MPPRTGERAEGFLGGALLAQSHDYTKLAEGFRTA